MKTEQYEVGKDGTPRKFNATAKHIEPSVTDVLVLPPSRFGVFKRRVVVYPSESMRPWPLATGEYKAQPGTFSAQDGERLYGPYWPSLLARALGLVEKMTVKDWVIVILVSVCLLEGAGNLYLGYKIAKYIHLV